MYERQAVEAIRKATSLGQIGINLIGKGMLLPRDYPRADINFDIETINLLTKHNHSLDLEGLLGPINKKGFNPNSDQIKRKHPNVVFYPYPYYGFSTYSVNGPERHLFTVGDVVDVIPDIQTRHSFNDPIIHAVHSVYKNQFMCEIVATLDQGRNPLLFRFGESSAPGQYGAKILEAPQDDLLKQFKGHEVSWWHVLTPKKTLENAPEYLRDEAKTLFVSSARDLLEQGKLLPDENDPNAVVFVKD
jgi:hypothetical protein